jgi:serine/threonine-protein kinase
LESGNSVPPPADSARAAAEVRSQLERVLSNEAFSGATRRSRLLRYLVQEALKDHAESFKESVIATEVFDRAPDYDPQIDSVVRVEVGRLRARLAEYYDKAGAQDPVRIEIPKGGYRPVFSFREAAPATGMEPVQDPAPAVGNRSWKLIAGFAIALIAILAAVAAWRMRTPATAASAVPPSIAVLPFINLGGDPADEYLGDGISEELTESLSEFNDLRVVARTSAFQYRGKSADIRDIGRDLRASAVIEGSIARRGAEFHVIAQLIRSSDGYHLWSHSYDASPAKLSSVEREIARSTREKLNPKAAPVDDSTPGNPEAHDLYIRAAYQMNRRTEASTRQAIELARQATAKDPTFAQPYVMMAACELQLNSMLAQSPHQAVERALADVAKALAIDPANSGAHAQKALLIYTDEWDWPQAEREFQLALASGSHGSAENLYGWCLMTRGRFAEAQKHLRIAAELDPLSLGPQLNQVATLMNERNYREAKVRVDEILKTAPTSPVALYYESGVGASQKNCPAATAASQALLSAYPDSIIATNSKVLANVACGRPAGVKEAVIEIQRKHPTAYGSPYSMAAGYAMINDSERAMVFLEKSAELRESSLMQLKVDPTFDLIRNDPRFIALERRIGLLD